MSIITINQQKKEEIDARQLLPTGTVIASPGGNAFKIMVDDNGKLETEPVGG